MNAMIRRMFVMLMGALSTTPRDFTSPSPPKGRGALLGTPAGLWSLLRPQFARHLREVVHVPLDVLLRVLHRQRPVLLRSGRHEHPAVALVQPRQVGGRLVDRQVVAIVAYALSLICDAATGG